MVDSEICTSMRAHNARRRPDGSVPQLRVTIRAGRGIHVHGPGRCDRALDHGLGCRRNPRVPGGDTPVVPGYEIRRMIGRGGMGIVYEALQSRASRVVALKMIRHDAEVRPDQLLRFQFEAQAVARLRHPNVVQIYDVGEVGGVPYFSLELLEGGDAQAERLSTGRCRPERPPS